MRPVMALAVAVAALAGCGAPAARQDAAALAGTAFETALAAGDHARACSLLAPATRAQLEQDTQQACSAALAGQDLSAARGVRRVEAYGRQAQVRMAGDTLFLSMFSGGWKIVAAGCTPRPDRPYDCRVKGA
ncbi:hypothetical protein [Streptomyces sp. NPDC047014]|uniref:hypothetical protein n=1 Tax=Streptomyces sp. NPDC047014 TaxID=3155736 RepID=UPI00340DB710